MRDAAVNGTVPGGPVHRSFYMTLFGSVLSSHVHRWYSVRARHNNSGGTSCSVEVWAIEHDSDVSRANGLRLYAVEGRTGK